MPLLDVPWQHAVYTRRNRRESYIFSHARRGSLRKSFAASLKVKHLAELSPQANLQAMRDAPVLVLVTGKWAIPVSVEAYAKHKGCLEQLPLAMYTPCKDLPETQSMHFAECEEVGKDYRVLCYQSTLATYQQGERHDWPLCSVVPMLSDLVVLPKRLDERNLKGVMASFGRATRKCLQDSMIVAANLADGAGGRVNKTREVDVVLK
jgi:hypothetical protein